MPSNFLSPINVSDIKVVLPSTVNKVMKVFTAPSTSSVFSATEKRQGLIQSLYIEYSENDR